MKKLMYLAITFFTFIFSFIAPIKNNFNININNNKIVEKLEPKKAFDNAPEKEIDLPGYNREFKLFFNISTLEELNEFYNTYSVSGSNAIYYFIGLLDEKINAGENLYYSGFFISSYNSKIQFYLITELTEVNIITPYLVYSIGKQNNNLAYWDDPEITIGTEMTTDSGVNYFISSVNELFSGGVYKSLNKTTIGENQYEISGTFSSNFVYGYDLIQASAVPGLIETISSIATGLLSLLISLFSSVVAIFWNVSNNTPTFLGVVTLFVVAVPITYWVINFVIGLIKKIRLTRGK